MGSADRTTDPIAKELMDTFQWSYEQQTGAYQRLEQLQRSYDNQISKFTWPTTAKIPTAKHFTMVENELAGVFESLLLSISKFMSLMPATKGVTAEQLDKSLFALKSTLLYRMKLYYTGMRTLKDCFKLGVGFGIVEKIKVSPPAAMIKRANSGGKVLEARVMGVGRLQDALRFRYVNPGRVIPYPNGTDFNGDDRVDIAFFVDDYPEEQFRRMFASQPAEGEAPALTGNVEDIIKEARSYGLTAESGIQEMMDVLGGRAQRLKGSSSDGRAIKCRVPVIKCYENYANRHTWLALGKYVIYREDSQAQTMRCPMIKATAWLDSTRFFPMSTPEANRVVMWTENVWASMVFDMMVEAAKRPLLYDRNKIKNMPPHGPSPRQAIPVDGITANVASYLQSPTIDAGTMGVGNMLRGISGDITGQRDLTEKNFTRGGMMSFQDLLSTTGARGRLTAAILNTGFVGEVASQVLAYLQVGSSEAGEPFRTMGYDQKTSSSYVKEMTVTSADLMNSMEVFMDPVASRKIGTTEDNSRLAKFDRMSNSEYFDQFEVSKMLCDDEGDEARYLLPREEVIRKQKLVEEARRNQGARQGEPTSMGQQAMQGAEAPQ